MTSKLLTKEDVEALGFAVVSDGRYTQALHDVIVAYRAARRSGSASTRTKAEVSLSGSKPWRQKGTGRARAGYKSSPVWVGGGVVFGPKPRSYRKSVSKTVRRKAFQKAFSLRVISGDVFTIDTFTFSCPKTREVVSFIESLGLNGSVLVVSDSFSEFTYLASRNLPQLQLTRFLDLNAEDLMKFRNVVVTRSGMAGIVSRATE